MNTVMPTVANHLARAVRSLSAAEKATVAADLLADIDFRQAVVEFLVGKLPTPTSRAVRPGANVPEASTRHKGKKQRGSELRTSYLDQLRQAGVEIERVESTWVWLASGLSIALPVATGEFRKGRWFLGVDESRAYSRNATGVAVILLCRTDSGDILDFILPPGEVAAMLPKLSRSKGQLKFNVRKVDGRFYLAITAENDLDITSYKSRMVPLVPLRKA